MFEGRLVFHDGVSEQILTYDSKIPGSCILQLMTILCKMRSGHIFHLDSAMRKDYNHWSLDWQDSGYESIGDLEIPLLSQELVKSL